MRAMILEQPKQPLRMVDIPIPKPREKQLLVQVHTCGVCRTDLHIYDGELNHPKLPLILGHQIVGTVTDLGPRSNRFHKGQRIGIPWLAKTCGTCLYCLKGKENLCINALFTGYSVDGGFAEYCVAHEDYCFEIPPNYSNTEAAPLLCAGLIGYRSLRFTRDAQRLGFYGFGSSAHLMIQIANYQKRKVYAFTRPGDNHGQEFAKSLGAVWAGDSTELPPEPLDAAIIFAPVGALIPQALKAVDKGGSVVCAGIYMSEIPSFSYDILYNERIIQSVTNLTRQDGTEFFKIASEIHLHSTVTTYPLEKANEAILDLHQGKISGSAVLVVS